MNIRIKVEKFYEVEVPDATISETRDLLESVDAFGEAKVDQLIRDKADYIGRDVYFEDAKYGVVHKYTQIDA